MSSVVIAAHNEEAVIAACLAALAAQDPTPHVVVSANGCRDRTAAVARAAGAVVIERPEPGKAGALNAGDAAAAGFPRVYLDADIVVPPGGLAALDRALRSQPGVCVAVPHRRVDTTGCTWPVRAYAAINSRLPAYRTGLFGRGMIALSAEGRARFDAFPDVIADDLYLDSLFGEHERIVVASVEVVVYAPQTTRQLLARLARVRRGNTALRAAGGSDGAAVRRSDRWAWLRDVVVPEPRLAAAAVPYVAITLAAAVLARLGRGGWGTDASSRVRAGQAATA